MIEIARIAESALGLVMNSLNRNTKLNLKRDGVWVFAREELAIALKRSENFHIDCVTKFSISPFVNTPKAKDDHGFRWYFRS